MVANKGEYKVATTGKERGKKIHTSAIKFEQITKSEFCASCHQVAVNLGIKLEVVWDQYRDSPARAAGITCQDCHMGKVPGVPDGYATGPAAVVNGKPINEGRKHANHTFYGPGYAIAHPGIFPHNPDAENWTAEEWLQFDYRAEWGMEDFEDKVEDGTLTVEFPEAWSERDDREEAREVIDANIAGLEIKRELRREVRQLWQERELLSKGRH